FILVMLSIPVIYIFTFFFSFTDSAPPEIYTLSLHDALPIFEDEVGISESIRYLLERDFFIVSQAKTLSAARATLGAGAGVSLVVDRKSTRLNSSHSQISYAVFCLKKKKRKIETRTIISLAT